MNPNCCRSSRCRATILAECLPALSSSTVRPSPTTTDARLASHPPPPSFPTQAPTVDQHAFAAFLSIPHKPHPSNGIAGPKSPFEPRSPHRGENPFAARREPEPKTPTETKKSSDPSDPTNVKATGHFADIDDALRKLAEYERHSESTMAGFCAEREQILKERQRMAEELQRELERRREIEEAEKEKSSGYDRSRDPRLKATDPRLRPLG